MNNLVIVVKNGQHVNLTLAGIMYDKFGSKINQNLIICDDWVQGFNQAKTNNYQQALFVDSGTVITDWQKFTDMLKIYPHQGLVAHLIWHPQKKLHLDQQCWYMELDKFNSDDFVRSYVQHPVPVRSQQNLHDDYTPLWVRADPHHSIEYPVDAFGQGLIARQLNHQHGIVNWHNKIRNIKFFVYPNQIFDVYNQFQDYIDLAEHQFWVLNNENISASSKSTLLMPGSGLAWMLNIVQPSVKQIQIVDISQTQLKFCNQLWSSWNGNDYGSFCWDFIRHNQLVHYELDQVNLSALERLKLRSRSKFVEYVNQSFAKIMPKDFTTLWNQARDNKKLLLANDNLVRWVLNNDISQFDSVWCSNILDYKWTLLNTTAEECNQFKHKLKTYETSNQ
jgi:hypothetical protein